MCYGCWVDLVSYCFGCDVRVFRVVVAFCGCGMGVWIV